ncbi:hypothetical protein [Kitasatospora fiedleri]|uniref:hypothetical protein n=1 Tax=Kitasatospora fiedleri TaxID=2991545 RepID=UPI00249CE240|nr:hypothetical protein [Kitasatospora fiedleri]
MDTHPALTIPARWRPRDWARSAGVADTAPNVGALAVVTPAAVAAWLVEPHPVLDAVFRHVLLPDYELPRLMRYLVEAHPTLGHDVDEVVSDLRLLGLTVETTSTTDLASDTATARDLMSAIAADVKFDGADAACLAAAVRLGKMLISA